MIASVTQPFCADCTRARLTADGQLYTCLFASAGRRPARAAARRRERCRPDGPDLRRVAQPRRPLLGAALAGHVSNRSAEHCRWSIRAAWRCRASAADIRRPDGRRAARNRL